MLNDVSFQLYLLKMTVFRQNYFTR